MNVDFDVIELLFINKNELITIILNFIKVNLFVNFYINQLLLKAFDKRRNDF